MSDADSLFEASQAATEEAYMDAPSNRVPKRQKTGAGASAPTTRPKSARKASLVDEAEEKSTTIRRQLISTLTATATTMEQYIDDFKAEREEMRSKSKKVAKEQADRWREEKDEWKADRQEEYKVKLAQVATLTETYKKSAANV